MKRQKITMDIPYKVSTNKIYSSVHWRERKEIADMYHMFILSERGKFEPVEDFPVFIMYRFIFEKNALDSLNLAFMAKMIEDGMVREGILPDDSPKYVTTSILDTKKGDKDQIEIHIIPVGEKDICDIILTD